MALIWGLGVIDWRRNRGSKISWHFPFKENVLQKAKNDNRKSSLQFCRAVRPLSKIAQDHNFSMWQVCLSFMDCMFCKFCYELTQLNSIKSSLAKNHLKIDRCQLTNGQLTNLSYSIIAMIQYVNSQLWEPV
jgi:hypothetical protein